MRRLLRGTAQGGGRDPSREDPAGVDPTVLSELLQQARRELPHFRYRHGDEQLQQQLPVAAATPEHAASR